MIILLAAMPAMPAIAALLSPVFLVDPVREVPGRAEDGANSIVAVATAYFIKEGERIPPGMTPFESLRWSEEPIASAVRAAVPAASHTWLYSEFECKGISRSGHLKGCHVRPTENAAIRATSQRTLRLLRDFAVSKTDAALLRKRTTGVYVSFQIQFAGVTDEGDCGALGFCSITPPPPPPPPPQPKNGS